MKFLGGMSVVLIALVLAMNIGVKLPTFATSPAPAIIVVQEAPTPIAPTRVKVIDKTAFVKAIKSNAFLMTTTYDAQAKITIERQGHLFGLVNGERVHLVAFGTVRAGVDLSALRQSDVVVTGTTLVVSLPTPKIESVTLEESRSYVADHSLTWFSEADPALADQARRLAVTEIERIACLNDLEQRTERDVEAAMKGLVGQFGFTDVQVIVPQSAMCER